MRSSRTLHHGHWISCATHGFFRHLAIPEPGSPSRIRTSISAFRAQRPAVERRAKNWSGCEVPTLGLLRPRQVLFRHELHPDGAHGVTRTRIFTSVYGSPVRSRRRVRAHGTTSGS